MDRDMRREVASPDNRVFVSSASVWEIAIKLALGRLVFPIEQFDDIARRMGFDVLPIRPVHAIAAGALPRYHADPFDRMLIAQAVVENLLLATSDKFITRYDVRIFGSAKA
jgi:PIN domain nuclease of toxin-antitoxin system